MLYAVLLCVTVVLPRPELPPDGVRALVDEVQRMCLKYALALLLTGIVFTHASSPAQAVAARA